MQPSVEELAARAAALVPAEGRALLGLTGAPGSGKSTLAATLVAALVAEHGDGWAVQVPMDGFHLADVELDRLGRRNRKGAPDTFDAAGYVALLQRLKVELDGVVYAPAFERDLEQPIAGAIAVPSSARLVVTEGNYLLLDNGRWAQVRGILDEVWFCDLDPTLLLPRLVARHVLSGKPEAQAHAWVEQVDGSNARLVEQTRGRADLVVQMG